MTPIQNKVKQEPAKDTSKAEVRTLKRTRSESDLMPTKNKRRVSFKIDANHKMSKSLTTYLAEMKL